MKELLIQLAKNLLVEIESYKEARYQLFKDSLKNYPSLTMMHYNDWLEYERLLAEGYSILTKEEYDTKNS